MEVDNNKQKPEQESDSESDSEASSSGSSYDCSDEFSDDDYLSPLGPDGLPWGTKPYQFEPMASKGDEHASTSSNDAVDEENSASSNKVDYASRLINLDWYVIEIYMFASLIQIPG